ncbi:aspartoacylase [Glaciecola sp. MH2013]|nr:aspartoacylase [Glaciecola sp. MH2013]
MASVLLAAGTHGNELSGIEFVRKIQRNKAHKLHSILGDNANFSLETCLVNELAIEKRARFVEEDLNRQFSQEKLSVLSGENLEHQLAIEFNHRYGPKHESRTDLVIDVHNTTSNMGPTLIILELDDFNSAMARFVKAQMPEAVILIEDEKPFADHAYLCTVGKRGVMIEVGPQPQGVLRPAAYLQTETMTRAILAFCQAWNQHLNGDEDALRLLSELTPVDAFRLTEEVSYPLDEDGHKCAMIHPMLQDKDFLALNEGEPVFLDFDHNAILWQGSSEVYPHFIGESAYYHLNVAFALADKTRI